MLLLSILAAISGITLANTKKKAIKNTSSFFISFFFGFVNETILEIFLCSLLNLHHAPSSHGEFLSYSLSIFFLTCCFWLTLTTLLYLSHPNKFKTPFQRISSSFRGRANVVFHLLFTARRMQVPLVALYMPESS